MSLMRRLRSLQKTVKRPQNRTNSRNRERPVSDFPDKMPYSWPWETTPLLIVERINPDIQETFVSEAEAVFDPVLSAEISAQRNDRSSSDLNSSTTDIYQGSLSLKGFFPWAPLWKWRYRAAFTDDSQYSDPYAKRDWGFPLPSRCCGDMAKMPTWQKSVSRDWIPPSLDMN